GNSAAESLAPIPARSTAAMRMPVRIRIDQLRYLGMSRTALSRSIALRSQSLNIFVSRSSAAVPLAVRNGKSVPNRTCEAFPGCLSDDGGYPLVALAVS